MARQGKYFGAAKEVVLSFLERTLPFNELSPSQLDSLSQSAMIAFYPKGKLIMEQDRTEVLNLYVIQKGGVRVFLKSDDGSETLVDYRGEGASFGALALIRGSRANLNVQTVEDTFCYLFPDHLFTELIAKNPAFATHYLKSLSQKLVESAYSELRFRDTLRRSEDSIYLFASKISDIARGDPKSVDMDDSIHNAAKKMSEFGIGSLLVKNHTGDFVGIVTHKDLTSKVVAKRLGYDEPVRKIMSGPIRTVSGSALCFDAVLEMMTQGLSHLVVESAGNINGIVTAHDILVAQGSSPLFLLREIDSQNEIRGLYALSRKIVPIVRSLIEEGAKADNIARVISVLNDRMIHRLLTLMIEDFGPPPVPFCWIVMGSEGRKEQTFRTDQDNAIIYEEPLNEWEMVKRTKLYFRRFGNQAIKHLVACGYPLCKWEMMASFSRWRKPYNVWVGYFERWIAETDPVETLNAKILFDFRPIFGSMEIGAKLRTMVSQKAQKSEVFLKHLASDCLAIEPPLSFFRNFLVERNGEHKNRVDLKLRGLTPVVDFARMMALKYGKTVTNTIDRLTTLMKDGHIDKEVCSDLLEAYNFVMHLRLVWQLRVIEKGSEPHNFVDPADLSDLEKITLKEAFSVIKRTQIYAARIRAEM
ncbi:MAG: putative nucleotidyltransferase substrate binding domain-containing protein [Desulfomonilaceae bacterium]